jgi:phage gp37-like protein
MIRFSQKQDWTISEADMGLGIKDVEDAVLATLQAATDLTAVCKNVDAYGGEIDKLMAQVEILTVNMPAVYVLYAGSDFAGSRSSWDDNMTVSIVVVAKDLRGRKSQRVGVYEILEILKAELIDNDLGLDIEPLEPVKILPVMTSDKFSIYLFALKTFFSISS